MAEFTPNYGLHQWEPTDNFLRTDFNEDFSRIDTALGRAESSAESSAYNVYNLMLQNYYEGKYTGYKKALVFDGFLDGTGISGMSAGVVRLTDPACVRLYAKGVGDRIQNYGTTTWVCPGRFSDGWTQEGRSQATGVKLRVAGGNNYGSSKVRVTLSSGKQSVYTELSFAYPSVTEVTLTFPSAMVLEGGSSYSLTVESRGEYSFNVYTSVDGSLGYHLLCTPLDAPTGTVTVPTANVNGTGTLALAWVRHSGGTVGLRLNGTDMEEVSRRGAKTLQGTSCTERAFRLEGSFGPSLSPILNLDAQGGDTVTVYDYGVVLI